MSDYERPHLRLPVPERKITEVADNRETIPDKAVIEKNTFVVDLTVDFDAYGEYDANNGKNVFDM